MLLLLENSYLNWLWALPKQLAQLFSVDVPPKPKFHMALTSPGMGKTRLLCEWAAEALQRDSILLEFVHGVTNKKRKESFEWIFPSLPVENDPKNSFKSKMVFLYELLDAVECDRHFGFSLPLDFAASEASPIIIRDILSTAVLDALLVNGRGNLSVKFLFSSRKKYYGGKNKELCTFGCCDWISFSLESSKTRRYDCERRTLCTKSL